MGFLSGAYGKLMAGRLVRQLQWQLTSVQSRLNRVTKQVGDMEKNLQSQERMINMQNTFAFNQIRSGMMLGLSGQQGAQSGSMEAYNLYTYGIQGLQQQMMYQQTMMAEQFDMMRDMMLEPLKAIQEDLEVEKDNLESRLEIAKGQYEAKKKEEQDGAKNMVPDYTGQGS